MSKTVRTIDNKKATKTKKVPFSGFLNLLKIDTKNIPNTVQESLPYKRIFKNGLAYIGNKKYARLIEFEDVNYAIASDEEENNIFSSFCDLINYFNDDVDFQLVYLNQKIDPEDIKGLLKIDKQKDIDIELSNEYESFIMEQLQKANNGIIKRKLLVFSIEAENPKQALSRLNEIGSESLKTFSKMGSEARLLNGTEYIEVLFRCMNRSRAFNFNWDENERQGITTKNAVCPDGLDFSLENSYKMGKQICASHRVEIIAEKLPDNMLSELLSLDISLIVSIHLRAMNQIKAQKLVGSVLANVGADIVNAQTKASEDGHNVISKKLTDKRDNLEQLSDRLSKDNEKLFDFSFIVQNIADNPHLLAQEVKLVDDKVQQFNCVLRSLTSQQEQGLYASLPLCVNTLKIEKPTPTTAVSVLIPFRTKTLFSTANTAFYYGLDKITKRMIRADKTKLRSLNGAIFGSTGSGKSFAAKLEMLAIILQTDWKMLVIDPDNEYHPFINALGGQVITISTETDQYINPLDIDLKDTDIKDHISAKLDFILSFIRIIEDRTLTAMEKSIIGRCLPPIYKNYLANPIPKNMPILNDLRNELLKQPELEAKHIAGGLELYTVGQWQLFNHRTNINIKNRLVAFNINSLRENVRQLGMQTIQQFVSDRIAVNRKEKGTTALFVDEFHVMLRHEDTSLYFLNQIKRIRKYGSGLIGVTQNIKEMLSSPEATNILQAMDFFVILNQKKDDREIIQERLQMSDQIASFVTNSGEGEGVIVYDDLQLPFINQYPKDTKTYKIMSTKISDHKEEEPDPPDPKEN